MIVPRPGAIPGLASRTIRPPQPFRDRQRPALGEEPVHIDAGIAYPPGSTDRRPRMTVTITAFESAPDEGRGLARDMPVRWALEEAGVPYAVRLVSFEAMKQEAHRRLQPFGQIPTYEEGDLVLFESGAIVFHVAQRHPGLLPDEPNARARAVAWMFAALSTVETPIVEREAAGYAEGDRRWHEERLPTLEKRIQARLDDLCGRLGGADWLDGEFSAGDLLMVSVLRRLGGSDILAAYPALEAYVARAEARPA
ncbi:MAG TPA: glutathione S-transferase family protein, partial [Allosphingosinicella sp.]|nr:glutathione S-transferase family protein [Allosphingosinicella sp.]